MHDGVDAYGCTLGFNIYLRCYKADSPRVWYGSCRLTVFNAPEPDSASENEAKQKPTLCSDAYQSNNSVASEKSQIQFPTRAPCHIVGCSRATCNCVRHTRTRAQTAHRETHITALSIVIIPFPHTRHMHRQRVSSSTPAFESGNEANELAAMDKMEHIALSAVRTKNSNSRITQNAELGAFGTVRCVCYHYKTVNGIGLWFYESAVRLNARGNSSRHVFGYFVAFKRTIFGISLWVCQHI